MMSKVIGVLLLALLVATIVGMVIKNDAYWGVYNYVTIMLSAGIGISLLKQK